MVAVHRGAGMIVPIIGILSALIVNIVTAKVFDHAYYQEHVWPKASVLVLAGLGCLILGVWLQKKRTRAVRKEQAYIDSLSDKSPEVKEFAFSGPRDHLLFIPVQYWSIVYFLAALIYGIKSL